MAGAFPILLLISLLLGAIGFILLLVMLVWMIIDIVRRKELTGGKKVVWIISFFIIFLTMFGYYIDVKRKDWDPKGEQRTLFIAITAIAVILMFAGAFFGIFYGF